MAADSDVVASKDAPAETVRWRLVLEFDGVRESWDLDSELPLKALRRALPALEEFVGGQARLFKFGRV